MINNNYEQNEYRIEIKIKNNLFLERLESSGYKTIGEFCRINKMSPQELSEIVNMKYSPFLKKGEWRKSILKCCEILLCEPEDFFTETQLNTILSTNKKVIKVKEAEMKFMLESRSDKLLEEMVLEDQLNGSLNKILNSLTPKENKVINLRFGLNGEEEHTLKEVGNILNISNERVRQIEAKSLRKLRSPSILNEIRKY